MQVISESSAGRGASGVEASSPGSAAQMLPAVWSTAMITPHSIADTMTTPLTSRITLAQLQPTRPVSITTDVSHELKCGVTNLSTATVDGSATTTTYGPMQISAQVLSLPRSITNCCNLSRPLTLCYAGRQVIVPPSCIVLGSEGAKLLLPPQTVVPSTPLPDPINLSADGDDSISCTASVAHDKSSPLLMPSLPSKSESALETVASEKRASLVPLSAECKEPASEQMTESESSETKPSCLSTVSVFSAEDQEDQCKEVNIGRLNDTSLVHIFTFLRLFDLLQVSCVCSRWNAIAHDPSLWKTVTLDQVFISDWKQAAEFLSSRHIESLMMTQLISVSASDVECLLTHLPELTSLHVAICDSWTSQTFVSLGQLARLHTLTLECSESQPTLTDLACALANMTRLDSLTLKRFTVTESLGLDKLTWLRLLHVDDSATSTASAATAATSAVASTLSVVRQLSFLRRLEWTFNSEPIPLSRRHILGGEDVEPAASTIECLDMNITVAELQSFLRQCIPDVDVELRVHHP